VNPDALKLVHERRMNIDPLSMWDDQCVEGLRQDWQVPMLTVFDLVSSTNDTALAQAARGAPDGSVVIANHQSSGRGQHGRRWYSHEGKSLLMSMILSASTASRTHVQGQATLAIAATLQEILGLDFMMKPPNDVLSRRRRKIAGVLAESSADGRVVLGVGINVLQDPNDWPPELRESADSLHMLGCSVRRHVIAGALIRRLRAVITGHGVASIPDRIRRCGSHAVARLGEISIRVDSSDHAGIWTRR
jgi:BirA family biotin operon repressor/biotin-[acetyl-CoA-carboxylase] ligase